MSKKVTAKIKVDYKDNKFIVQQGFTKKRQTVETVSGIAALRMLQKEYIKAASDGVTVQWNYTSKAKARIAAG